MSIEAPIEAGLDVDAQLQRGACTLRLTFMVPPGVTVLFGPSGAGKSSTLALVAGLLPATSGIIRLHRPPESETWLDVARGVALAPEARRAALVFQGLALFPHLTAEANVAYGLSRALPARTRRENARASLARWQVAHLEGRLPATFSGGEARRVALARGFAMNPRVLLLDEPFSGIDAPLRQTLLSELRRALDPAPRIPVLYVTHDPAEARAVADRVLLLEGGRVVAGGEGAALLPT